MSAQRKYTRRWAAPLGVLALLLCSTPAAAQQAEFEAARCEDDAPWETNRSDNESYPRNQCAPQRSPFNLFGTGDFAGSGLRGAAPDVKYFTTNTGLSDTGRELQGQTLPFGVLGVEEGPTNWCYQNFELQFFAAAARGDWVRNRELQPTLNAVTGGGWTYSMNTQRLGGYHQWTGKDGSVGLWHSGAQSGGGGCLDHGPGYQNYPNGFPLLAGSDCPETWGSAGWLGRNWIGPIDTWAEYFEDAGPCTGYDPVTREATPEGCFTFDHWRVPEFYYSAKENVGDFAVFGVMTDAGRQNRERFGAVIPGQDGDPTLEGYPLGLDVYFNAFAFKVPSLSRGFIWEGLIVNHTEEYYGVPLDYDSLWFGQLIRPLRDNGGGRRANPHAIPELGAIVHNELGRTADCDGALPVPQSINCSSPRGRTPGFTGGTQGHLILKSPIGDLRNKHFSDPNSPFFAPDHPFAGDTITFNRMSICSYRCTIQQFIFDARKGFGIISAEPSHALDGRDPVNDISPFERWELFHQTYAPDGSERFCDPNNPREPGCFGYKVPGDWEYTNRPPGTAGGPDTLWIDNCRPPTDVTHPGANECTGTWADTLPDKVLNWTQNVIWPAVGPFPLAAGDTAPYVTATFAAPDSFGLMSSLEAFYNIYVNDFYLGPGLPTPPGITSVTTEGTSARLGEVTVTLFLDDAAEEWVDPFAVKALSELRNPKPGTIFDQVARADPGAADRLEDQLFQNNVDSIYIYKSCDRGRSFTSDASGWECDPSPTYNTTGQTIGTGWESFDILLPENGAFASTWVDQENAAGLQFLYTMVAHTPGIHLDCQYWADTDEDGVEDEIRDTTLTFVPEGSSVFTTSTGEDFVVEVYVPASAQAGSELALAELDSRTGAVPFDDDQIAIIPETNARSEGQYSLYFGSDAIVTEYRSAPDVVDSTVIQLERSVRALMPDETLEDLIVDTVVYYSQAVSGLLLATTDDASTTISTVGDILVTETEFNAKTGILMDDGEVGPIFLSSRLETGFFTPGKLLTHPLTPQFVVEVSDEVGEYVRDHWAIWNPEEENWDDLRDRSNPSVGWLQGSSDATGNQYGYYFTDWGAPAYSGQVAIDVVNPQTTQDAYTGIVDFPGREVARTEVNQDVLDAINRDIDPSLTLDDLIEVGIPFDIYNVSAAGGGAGDEVRIAMLADSKLNEVLLGNAPDTVTAPVPADVWVPGEPLILLEQLELALTNPDGTLQRDGTGQPILGSQLRATWSEALFGCDDPRPTCNPVSGPRLAGSPGHVYVRPNGMADWPDGWDLIFYYKNAYTSQTSFVFDMYPARTDREIERVTSADMDSILVVPNPYIGRSAYEVEGNVRRLLFTKLPPAGELQIFTASGQFIQRLSWAPGDLQGSGDLYWNMQTREGNLIASGLYVFVVESVDNPNCVGTESQQGGCGGKLKHLGRFIVIR
jgi:hypothetical protein